MGILHLQERQRIRLFVHPDRFGRFCSCIVFVPRDRYDTRIRLMIQGILEEAFGGTDHRVHGEPVRVGAGPALLRHPPRPRRAARPELGRRGSGAAAARGEPHLGRRSARRPARRLRRGARHTPRPALRRGVPRRLPRELLRPRRGAGRGEDGAHRGRRHRDEPLPPARGGRGTAALQALPSGAPPGGALRRAADAGEHGPEGRGRASEQDQARRRVPDLAARLRHAPRGRPRLRPRPHRRDVPRRLRPHLVG